MGYLVFMLVAILLLAGFMVLTWYEERRGTRFLALKRAQLDEGVEHVERIATHADLMPFLREELRHLLKQVGRKLAQLSLEFVRSLEQLLSRLVHRLHSTRPVDTAPRENVREFVKTLSDFKGQLEATRREVPEV